MSDNDKSAVSDKVTEKFGANAAKYATSKVHAKGASLGRIVEMVAPQADWKVLDIASAAGHNAWAFAPHVAEVVSTDLTPEMLEVAAGVAAERGITNASFQLADAEDLPFEDGSFNLVTSRIAPHHFPNPATFVSEAFRVLRPGGVFALVDNIVPADDEPGGADVATFVNQWEKKRDPSHVRALSVEEWVGYIEASGGQINQAELLLKKMEYTPWADRMNVPKDVQPVLLDELRNAGDDVHAFLRPDFDSEDDAFFHLTEGLIVASKS